MENFKNKVVVITGSAGGIGFALAKQFGLDGAKIVISDLPGDRIEAAVSNLQQLGVEASGFACDVTNRDEVEALAQHAVNARGRVDVIVNNAGIAQAPTPLIDMNLAVFRRIYEVNIYGLLNGIHLPARLCSS
jgi:NAD(P)-dependent dehydrogenase (short-subunit alcohol dehydrogenase family)